MRMAYPGESCRVPYVHSSKRVGSESDTRCFVDSTGNALAPLASMALHPSQEVPSPRLGRMSPLSYVASGTRSKLAVQDISLGVDA
jgi:hypothetical protein